jgi:hypothetical protein
MKGIFEIRTIRDGIKVVTNDMADYSTIIRHLDSHKVPHYTFHPKSLEPVKAVI